MLTEGVVLTKTLTVSKYYFLLFIALAVIMGSLMEVSIGKLLISGVVPGLLMAAMYHVYGLYCGTLHAATEPRAGLFSGEGLLVGKDYFPCQTRTAFRHHYLCGNRSDLRGSGHAYRIGCDGGCGTALVVSFPFPNIMIVAVMQGLMIILGTFMEPVSIMMITFPVYMPIVRAFGFDPIWFGLLTLINMEIGMKTPPFGMVLFVMKGVVPPKTTMLDIYRSVTPFVAIDGLAMLLIMIFPTIATVLPNLMKY